MILLSLNDNPALAVDLVEGFNDGYKINAPSPGTVKTPALQLAGS